MGRPNRANRPPLPGYRQRRSLTSAGRARPCRPGRRPRRSIRRPAGPTRDDRRAGLEVGLRARLEADDRRLRIDDDRLFSALVTHGELGAARRVDAGRNVAVGHGAARRQIERAEALAGPAHRLGKDMHFHRLEFAALAGQRGDADELARLDVGERRWNHQNETRLGIEMNGRSSPPRVRTPRFAPSALTVSTVARAEATGGAFWARAGTKASADAAVRTMRTMSLRPPSEATRPPVGVEVR